MFHGQHQQNINVEDMRQNQIEKLEKKNLLSNNVINMHIWIMF